MRAKLFLASAIALGISQSITAQATDEFGYTQVELTMGPQYENRVFFDLSENTISSQPANLWDIAFYRNSTQDIGSRVNDAKNFLVYQVSANPADFETVNPANKDAWGEPIYNSDNTTRIQDGAFDNATLLPAGGMNFGWGAYNMATHKVEGKVVFVLEIDGTYYKFFINEFNNGYSFKYAKWNGTSWDATVTKTIANGSDDAFFNYFSFATGEKVENLEPAKANWDLMFTRYYTWYNDIMMYKMSGVIQSPNISVAKSTPETQATSTYAAPDEASYSKNITTIGHSWKPISGIYDNVVYYIKEGNDYYRLYFTSNGGSSTGDMFFKYKKITNEMAVADFGKKGSFAIYPNPTTADKTVNILFDVKETYANKGNVEIFDLTGKKVYETTLTNQTGFYKQELNLNKLTTGVYMVKISYGGQSKTKKLIVK